MNLVTIAAYQFARLKNLHDLRQKLKELCSSFEFSGTLLLAPEGINCFLCGEKENIRLFKEYLEKNLGLTSLSYKEHPCSTSPFVRMLVKIKREIITMNDPSIEPENLTAPYIEPLQLKEWLDQKKDIVLLDTRNHYEVATGTFNDAIHMNIKSFKEFPDASKALPAEMKDKTVVMFCTGGIRCEKASAYFLKNGYKDVYQLHGGILKYFEDCQDAHYSGNCFVFDWRLALDGNLTPQPRSAEEPVNAGRHYLKKDLSIKSID